MASHAPTPSAVPPLERRSMPAEIISALKVSADGLAQRLDSPHDPRLGRGVDETLGQLPMSRRLDLATALNPPGLDGAMIVTGLPVAEADLGPTPWSWRAAGSCGFAFELIMIMAARVVGRPFGWVGQQAGRLVNSIVPSLGQEQTQTGASSATTLTPHTEDAFHPGRANLLILGCLRNPDRVGTTIASVRRTRLRSAQQRLLATPVLPILPDTSYAPGKQSHDPPAVPTIWDGPDGTTLRYDPAYTPLERADAEHRHAYADLSAELDRVQLTAILEPGELLIIDNDVAVHGRVPFVPRYDGTDRWLKRINVRLPERKRPAAEAAEDGYGQSLTQPFLS